MDLHTDQLGFRSEILGYLDKQKQEKLEAAHSLPSVPSFRAQKGSGPYKKWESKPLKADDGQASTSGEDDDEEMGMSPTRRDQCLRYLFFMNGGLLLAVVVIGTLVGLNGSSSSLLLRSTRVMGIPQKPDPAHTGFPAMPWAPAPAPGSLPANKVMPLERMFAGAINAVKAGPGSLAPGAAAWGQQQQQQAPSAAQVMSDALAAHAAAEADYWLRQKEAQVARDEAHANGFFPATATGRGYGSVSAKAPPRSTRTSPSLSRGVPSAGSSAAGRAQTSTQQATPSVEGSSMDQWAPFRHIRAQGGGNVPQQRARPAMQTADGLTGTAVRKADVSDLIPEGWIRSGDYVP